MEEKKDKSDDPVVDLFPDDDADDRAGKALTNLSSLQIPTPTSMPTYIPELFSFTLFLLLVRTSLSYLL